MEKFVTDFYKHQEEDSYENSHASRLDFLVEDLKLNEIKDSIIYDFGGGNGFLFKRMQSTIGNKFYLVEGAETKVEYGTKLTCDLNVPFANNILSAGYPRGDFGFCFETIEHLPNPYNCLSEIKEILKPDGILYLSIPHVSVTHNTIYPALLYPVDNFKEFLRQMAFEIIDHRIHSKSFCQEVFTLKNKSWDFSQMRFFKSEAKFRGLSPVQSINL